MKRLLFLSVMIAMTVGAFSQSEIDAEKKAIMKVIDVSYVQGLQNLKDVENIEKGFHPGFNLLGIDQQNNLTKYPIYTWAAGAKKAAEAGREVSPETTVKFPMIDITGNAAVAKVELFKDGKQIFTDYLSLYKFEEGWKIVSKIYYRIPKE